MIAALLFAVLLNAASVAHPLDSGLGALAGTGSGQTPGLSVAVAQDGKITYARGFGTARVDTPFRIASVTKMFTAVSIMQLVAAHKLALDERVSSVLPNAPYADRITVRELLQHTSGLWNYLDLAFADGSVKKATTPQAILAEVARHPLAFTPGTKYEYSNSGYVVLGTIVEKLTGMPLAEYERRSIFTPAHMNATTTRDAKRTSDEYDPSWLYSDGDAISTASDLVRFDLALMNGSLLPEPLFAEMRNSTVATDEPSVRWGLGLTVVTQGGKTYVGHHGGLPDYAAENEMLLDSHLAIAVLADSGRFITARANGVVLSALDPSIAAAPASSPKPSLPEDPSVTARFRSSLESLMHGTIDRTQYTDQINAALTPALLAATARQLAPLGTIEKIAYAGMQPSIEGKRYVYDVTFSAGPTIRWGFFLAPDGKIASLVSLGKP